MRQSRWMYRRPNIGSRMNREVHVRFWERAEVKFLRATRDTILGWDGGREWPSRWKTAVRRAL